MSSYSGYQIDKVNFVDAVSPVFVCSTIFSYTHQLEQNRELAGTLLSSSFIVINFIFTFTTTQHPQTRIRCSVLRLIHSCVNGIYPTALVLYS